jgi:hypothetical protein
MNSESKVLVHLWRFEDPEKGFHLAYNQLGMKMLRAELEKLSVKEVGSTILIELSAPPEEKLAKAGLGVSDFLTVKNLEIESARPGKWELNESSDTFRLKIGLPWVGIFSGMLDIEGVSFGPTDEASKFHFWI